MVFPLPDEFFSGKKGMLTVTLEKNQKTQKQKPKNKKTTFLMVCGEFWWELWTWALPQDLGIFLKAIYLLAL